MDRSEIERCEPFHMRIALQKGSPHVAPVLLNGRLAKRGEIVRSPSGPAEIEVDDRDLVLLGNEDVLGAEVAVAGAPFESLACDRHQLRAQYCGDVIQVRGIGGPVPYKGRDCL